jgi:hypothetical protein
VQTQYIDAQTIQDYLNHRQMIFVPDLEPHECIVKGCGGRFYLLKKNDVTETENGESVILLKDIQNNKDIAVKLLGDDNHLSMLKEYGFRIRDFELNDKYFVLCISSFLYVFHRDKDSYIYLKRIGTRRSYDYLSIEDSKLKLLSCSVKGGKFEGEFQIIDLETESLSQATPLYTPMIWRFMYFQPKILATFFQGSFMQSEILRPVLYFNSKDGTDTVRFAAKDWVAMPDSIVNEINNSYTNEADKSPKMVIDNLRKYLKQYSFIHKLFTLSNDRVLVVWSVPSKRKLYDYRYTILQKKGNNYSIEADNLSDTPTNPNYSFSDFSYIMPFTSDMKVFDNYFIDIVPIPFQLEERHYTMSFLNLYKEIDQHYLQSEKKGFNINITELKNE